MPPMGWARAGRAPRHPIFRRAALRNETHRVARRATYDAVQRCGLVRLARRPPRWRGAVRSPGEPRTPTVDV